MAMRCNCCDSSDSRRKSRRCNAYRTRTRAAMSANRRHNRPTIDICVLLQAFRSGTPLTADRRRFWFDLSRPDRDSSKHSAALTVAPSVFHHISSHGRLAAPRKTLNFSGLFATLAISPIGGSDAAGGRARTDDRAAGARLGRAGRARAGGAAAGAARAVHARRSSAIAPTPTSRCRWRSGQHMLRPSVVGRLLQALLPRRRRAGARDRRGQRLRDRVSARHGHARAARSSCIRSSRKPRAAIWRCSACATSRSWTRMRSRADAASVTTSSP